jgi:hypothetical protein
VTLDYGARATLMVNGRTLTPMADGGYCMLYLCAGDQLLWAETGAAFTAPANGAYTLEYRRHSPVPMVIQRQGDPAGHVDMLAARHDYVRPSAPAPCPHRWREHVGLLERFDWCELCDEKRR